MTKMRSADDQVDAQNGAPETRPHAITVAVIVATVLAGLLILATIALAADLSAARVFYDAAKARSQGGAGDLSVGVILNVAAAAALVLAGLRTLRRQAAGRRLLIGGSWIVVGTALFWLLLLQNASVVIWASLFVVLGLVVMGFARSRSATDWFGAQALAPSPRVTATVSRWNRLGRQQQWVWSLIIIAALVALPFIASDVPLLGLISTEPGTDFPISLFNASRYALIAIGLNVVVGQAGLLDLGYVGFFAIGAYVTALFTSTDSELGQRYPWLVCVPIAMGVTMVFGLVLGGPTLRLRGDYLAIVTLGFGEIVRLCADNIEPLKGQVGFQNIAKPPGHYSDGRPIFTQIDGKPWFWLTVGVIVVVLILVGNLERSRVGRAWVAIREDEDAAEIMGVPTFRFKLWAFVIGAAVGGLSGSIYAGQIGFVNNQKFDPVTSILFLAAVVLGGAGNKVGVILGAFLISYIPDRFTSIAEYKYLIFGIALIVLMLFRPQGLIGARQRLLAYGRQAYGAFTRKPDQAISGAGALSDEAQTATGDRGYE